MVKDSQCEDFQCGILEYFRPKVGLSKSRSRRSTLTKPIRTISLTSIYNLVIFPEKFRLLSLSNKVCQISLTKTRSSLPFQMFSLSRQSKNEINIVLAVFGLRAKAMRFLSKGQNLSFPQITMAKEYRLFLGGFFILLSKSL